MRTKGWLITAGVLTVLGAILLGGVMTVAKWDFTRLSTAKYETNEYTITEEYQSVRVVSKTADVTFVPSKDGATTVRCVEESRVRHTVSVTDAALTVEVDDTRKWYHYIGIDFGRPHITVFLPADTYDTLTVETDTGDVNIPPDFTFASAKVTGHTGDVTYNAPATGDVSIQTTTGRIKVQNVTASGLSLTVSTGNIFVAGVDCQGAVSVNVSTGKAHLSDVQCQTLISDGSTGDLLLESVIVNGEYLA